MSDPDSAEDSIPKSFIQAVKDRLSHPVAGIFIIAWIVFNWRMLFFLAFSTSPAEARIPAAAQYTDWFLGGLWPLLTTIAYLALSPWLQVLVARWNGWVSEEQSSREYMDSLAQMRRRTELERRSLYSLQPAIKDQEEAKVQLELDIKRLNEQRVSLQHQVKMLEEASSTEWEPITRQAEVEQSIGVEVTAHGRLGPIKHKLDQVAQLKLKLRKTFPKFNWD